MTRVTNSTLSNLPPISSVDELYSTAFVLGHNMVLCCERLAKEMKICRNEDTALAFEELADQETAHISSIRKQAESAGAKVDSDINEIWLDQDLRGVMAREIADNPYLMTPYRALQLVIINCERVFEILSTLAADQEDDGIRRHAEALARGQLSEISGLRLRRRRAARSEIETAIDKEGLDTPPVGMDNFNRVVHTVDAIIRCMTLVVRDTWEPELTDGTRRVFEGLLDDAPVGLVEDEDHPALETRIRQGNDDLFSALKALLRELESAIDLFLGYAEGAGSEDVVHAAQVKAERYVRHIAGIRDELGLRMLE